jgi:hypothetical protein
MRNRILPLALSLLALGACSDSTGPDRSTDELVFARFNTGAQVQSSTASFWAVKGQDRRLELRYIPEPGETEGDRFLEFRVRPGSLLLKPGGQPFTSGDSVLITVTADPQKRFIFSFEPSGLTFSPVEPAELRIRYDRASDDLDRDGDTDDDDDLLALKLRIWQQAQPALPWLPVQTLRVDEEEVRGTIVHFTSFALAS